MTSNQVKAIQKLRYVFNMIDEGFVCRVWNWRCQAAGEQILPAVYMWVWDFAWPGVLWSQLDSGDGVTKALQNKVSRMLVRIDGLSVPLKVGLQVRLRRKLAITLQNEAEVKEYLESDL